MAYAGADERHLLQVAALGDRFRSEVLEHPAKRRVQGRQGVLFCGIDQPGVPGAPPAQAIGRRSLSLSAATLGTPDFLHIVDRAV